MRILDISKTPGDTQKVPLVFDKASVSQSGDGFQRQMSAMNQNAHGRYIDKLCEQITLQGDKLRKKADMNELLKYRSLVSELLNETVSNSYVCSSKNTLDARGRQKILVVIRSVNKKLDDVTKEVISGQADNLKLVSMVDEIKGLLLDLFL